MARETPRAPQTSATVLERSLNIDEAEATYFSSMTGFLAPFLPLALAASRPAIVLSRMMSRSNSAMETKHGRRAYLPG